MNANIVLLLENYIKKYLITSIYYITLYVGIVFSKYYNYEYNTKYYIIVHFIFRARRRFVYKFICKSED